MVGTLEGVAAKVAAAAVERSKGVEQNSIKSAELRLSRWRYTKNIFWIKRVRPFECGSRTCHRHTAVRRRIKIGEAKKRGERGTGGVKKVTRQNMTEKYFSRETNE